MRLIGELFFTLLWSMSFSLIALFLVTRMLWVGLGVTPGGLRDTLRARGLVIRALLANVVAVPLLAVAMVSVLPLPVEAVAAVLLLAAVPGGIDILSWRPSALGAAAGPSALVFLLSIVAIATSVAVRLLMPHVGSPMAMSAGGVIAVSVVGLLLPVLAGLVIRIRAPVAADVLSRVTAVLAVVFFIAASVAILAGSTIARHPPSPIGVVAMILFALGAGALGWLIGGPATPMGWRLAHVTAMRNVGLALMLATVAMPQGGVALTVVVFAAVLCVLRALLAWPALARRRRVSVDHAVPSA
jgi:BASS family bile acid:Na+ symporter